MGTLFVMLVRPEANPVMVEIGDSLEAMQEIVGGPIEVVKPWHQDIAIVCNEEGRLRKLAPNRLIYREDGEPFGCIYGTYFVCCAPHNSAHFMSLPRMMASRYEPYMVQVLQYE